MTKKTAKKKVNVARERFEDAIAQLTTSEKWLAWLRTRAKFHKYSFNNTMLIAHQMPEASQVAGYRKWEELGRQVRKGEKGIAIFAPTWVKQRDENGVVDEEAEKELFFRVVYVFDVSQTDGEDLPEIVNLLQGDSGLASVSLAAHDHAADEGLSVLLEVLNDGSNGYLDRSGKRVVVGNHLVQDASLKTLIHELAHWHDLGPETNEPYSRSEAEIVAESVAYCVASAYGLDTSDYSVGYVAHWADGDLDKIKALAQRVDKVSSTLLTALDAKLDPKPELVEETVAA